MPETSIIIPSFNRAHVVRAALADALGQSVHDLEVILVDDGSNDRTKERCVDELLTIDKRLRYIRHDENQGASAARNTGIRAADCRNIALLDSDDGWHERKLEFQLAALENTPPHELSAVSCDLVVCWEGGDKKTVNSEKAGLVKDLFTIKTAAMPCSTMLTPRATFEKVGLFDTQLGYGEDTDWLYRFLLAGGKMSIVPKVLATHNYTRKSYRNETASLDALIAKHGPEIYDRFGYRSYCEFVGSWQMHAAYRGKLKDEAAAEGVYSLKGRTRLATAAGLGLAGRYFPNRKHLQSFPGLG